MISVGKFTVGFSLNFKKYFFNASAVLATLLIFGFSICWSQEKLNIVPLGNEVYYHQLEYQKDSLSEVILLNGLVVNTGAGVVIVNTPPLSSATSELLVWIESVLNQPISMIISTGKDSLTLAGYEHMNSTGAVIVSLNPKIDNLLKNRFGALPFTPGFYTIGNKTFNFILTDQGFVRLELTEDKFIYLNEELVGLDAEKDDLLLFSRSTSKSVVEDWLNNPKEYDVIIPFIGQPSDVESILNNNLSFP